MNLKISKIPLDVIINDINDLSVKKDKGFRP